MDLKILYAILATILPGIELRGGMPLAVSYFIEKDFPLIFAFSIVILPGTIASYFANPLSDGFLARIAQFF